MRIEQPKIKLSSESEWRRYFEDKCREQHKEIMDFAVRLADVEARAEAVKNDFATRLADAEDKAEKYRLALEKCKLIIKDETKWHSWALDISGAVAETLK